MGVAAALALLDEPATTKLPPLECLFTVDEETGMTGAAGLDGSMLSGRTMLNLDTEEWGDVFIGCAGGGDTMLGLELERAPLPAGWAVRGWRLGGLLGGHSGLDIHEDRGSAVRLAARLVEGALAARPGGDVALVSFRGGDKRNAIAREAEFALAGPPEALHGAVAQAVAAVFKELVVEYGSLERAMSLDETEASAAAVLTPAATDRLLLLLLGLPHGVVKFSHAIPGLVETSTNLAAVRVKAEEPSKLTLEIITCTRSSVDSALRDVRVAICRIGRAAGAVIDQVGWAEGERERWGGMCDESFLVKGS